jgi:EAL domain-containing protein (putative c-di-GMP-specific phosphodiesterase class I)
MVARNHRVVWVRDEAVIVLGYYLKLQVVAEGIENQETWDLLASMGCDGAHR